MRVQLLPSTFDENGTASVRQHLMSVIVDDCLAVDAGSLAFACSHKQRELIRDVVLTHTHLDHIAGLPMFIDDLFATLMEPVRIHATREMIETLERDIFNWSIYPRFSELKNSVGPVVEYCEFERGQSFRIKHLVVKSIAVNHQVAANGYIVSDGAGAVGITGDTAETDDIWAAFNAEPDLKAILVECAFPDDLKELAAVSNHLTPNNLAIELRKFNRPECPVFVINIKPMYRTAVVSQLEALAIPNLSFLEIGKVYDL